MMRRVFGLLGVAFSAVALTVAGADMAAADRPDEGMGGSCDGMSRSGTGVFEYRPADGGFDMVRVWGMNPHVCVMTRANEVEANMLHFPAEGERLERFTYRTDVNPDYSYRFVGLEQGMFVRAGEVDWRR